MKIRLYPYLLQKKFPDFFELLGEFENKIINFEKISIEKPIFVCGIARSGTTLLTQFLSVSKTLGYFKYKDLPFIKIPYLWSFFNKFYFSKKNFNRIHGDLIKININSPDSFEELFWSETIKNYENYNFCKFIEIDDLTVNDSDFNFKILKNIKKILCIRSKNRYLSKNNYNFFRIKFLIKKFPDCKIFVCIRNPIDTARSLEKVHKKFIEISKKNESFVKEMNYLCHFEFGENAKSIICDSNEKNKRFWIDNEAYRGYIKQWIYVYQNFINKIKKNEISNKNVCIFDYNSFIKNPEFASTQILKFGEIEQQYDHSNFIKNIVSSNNYLRTNSDEENEALKIYSEILSVHKSSHLSY